MRVLTVIPDKQIQDMILLALEGKAKIDPVEVDDAEEAVAALETVGQTPFELVIADYPTSGGRLLKYQKATPQSETKWIFWTSEPIESIKVPADSQQIKVVSARAADPIADFYAAMAALSLSAAKSPRPKDDFCRIRAELLVTINPLRGDIFIRLSAQKFIKIFHEGESFDNDDLEKYYIRKGVEYFYLKSGDCAEFLKRLREMFLQIADVEEPNLPPADAKALIAAVEKNPGAIHETLHEITKTLGFTLELQEVVKACVKASLAAIKKGPKLSQLLAHLDRDREKYIASHSMLVAQLACMIAAEMDWKSDATYQKFSLAAILHDMSLRNQKLAAVASLEELEDRRTEFEDDERESYVAHPTVAAELCKRFTEIPPDVDVILSEHHERPDGTGFPRGLTHARIGSLSIVFIVAHDLTDYLLGADPSIKIGPGLLKGFVEKYTKIYTLGGFKKALRVIAKMAG